MRPLQQFDTSFWHFCVRTEVNKTSEYSVPGSRGEPRTSSIRRRSRNLCIATVSLATEVRYDPFGRVPRALNAISYNLLLHSHLLFIPRRPSSYCIYPIPSTPTVSVCCTSHNPMSYHFSIPLAVSLILLLLCPLAILFLHFPRGIP